MANDPELSKQFNPGSLAVMRDGGAPYVRESEQAGGRIKIEIHHKVRIADGGGVYNMGNLVAVTPKRHIEIHKGGSDMKSKISEYTEKEFLEFVKDIYTNNKKKFPTEESHIQAVLEFKN